MRVPPGFKLTLYADEALANDIYAMTLDPHGPVVVTSRGYVKTLHDDEATARPTRRRSSPRPRPAAWGSVSTATTCSSAATAGSRAIATPTGTAGRTGPPNASAAGFRRARRPRDAQGPDGWWYVIGGNDSGIGQRHADLPGSPIRDPEAGSLLRLTPDLNRREVIAQGFRNPYDFDFNPAGDLFTYDSDIERDVFLPWYLPTRLYHVALCRPSRLADQRLQAELGHGRDSTRHGGNPLAGRSRLADGRGLLSARPVPRALRGGLFASTGRSARSTSSRSGPRGELPDRGRSLPRVDGDPRLRPERRRRCSRRVALRSPSVAGKTRGAVYRVEYVGDGRAGQRRGRDRDKRRPGSMLSRRRQPLDAWSRARWMPIARELGPGPFLAAIVDDARAEVERVRAVEVVTELFGGLTGTSAKAGARSRSPMVRARVAWSLGRLPCDGFAAIVVPMAEDPDPHVRVAALEAMADRIARVDADRLPGVVRANLDHADRRVRLATTRLAALLPDPAWKALADRREADTPEARLMGAFADVWRHPGLAVHDDAVEDALGVLGATHDPALRMQAVRLIVLALGDCRLYQPPVEVETAYALAQPLAGSEATVRRILEALRPIFPSGQERLDDESARLLAMLEDDDPDTPGKVAGFWTGSSTATRDFHFLTVYARLRGPKSDDLTPRVASALLALDRKLQGQEQRNKQSWNERFAELADLLIARDARWRRHS